MCINYFYNIFFRERNGKCNYALKNIKLEDDAYFLTPEINLTENSLSTITIPENLKCLGYVRLILYLSQNQFLY